MEMFEPSLICRLCLVNLEEFKECYLINEEIEKLINSSTGISFQDVEDKNTLMMCITCYEKIKCFDEFKTSCIENQIKFKELESSKIEALVEKTEVEQDDDLIEYIFKSCEEEEAVNDCEEMSSLDATDNTEQNNEIDDIEVISAVNNISEFSKSSFVPPKQTMKTSSAVSVESLPKPKNSSPQDREKGKEIYQKLLETCHICQKKVEKNRMEGHINKHNENRAYKCPECGKAFYCKQLMRLHRSSIHTDMEILCDICNKTFPSPRALYAHKLRHKNKDKYKCEHCDKKFNNTNSLKRHLAIHSGVRDFVCGVCGVGFYRKFNLDTHVKNVHQEIKDHICPYNGCKKKFGYARLLRDHYQKHHVDASSINNLMDGVEY